MAKFISDISEGEFLEFVTKICQNEYETEGDHIEAIVEFNCLAEHPAGSDLIFYPEDGKRGPQAVVAEVKAWRAANGKPGFKPS